MSVQGVFELLLRRAISNEFRSQQHADAASSVDAAATSGRAHEEALAPRCRLCLGGAEDVEHGSLVSPCGCKGSCGHIHSGCLQQWQRVVWETGRCEKALTCDICKQPYQAAFAQAPFGPSEQLPLAQRLQHLAVRLARSPERAFRLWRYAILVGGLGVGARQGLTGLAVGMCLGVRLAAPVATFLFKLAPEVGMLAALVPASKPALRLLCCLFGSALAVEVALASAAGLMCGGIVGFCRGSAGVVTATAEVGRAGMGAAFALVGAAGAGASAARSAWATLGGLAALLWGRAGRGAALV